MRFNWLDEDQQGWNWDHLKDNDEKSAFEVFDFFGEKEEKRESHVVILDTIPDTANE